MSHSRSDAPDDSARCSSASRPRSASSSVNPWVQQRLDLSPLPQGHGEFRPGSAIRTRIAARAAGGKQGRYEGAAMRAHEQQGSCSLSSRGVPDLSNRRCSAPAKVPTGSRASSAALLDLGTRRRRRDSSGRVAEASWWSTGGPGWPRADDLAERRCRGARRAPNRRARSLRGSATPCYQVAGSGRSIEDPQLLIG